MAATTITTNNHPTEDVPFTVLDRRRYRFFMIDNEVIDDYACIIGIYALAVYNVLARFANQEGVCFPSLNTIAKRLGISKPSVIKALEALEAYGLIAKEHRFNQKGEHISNLYILLEVKKEPLLPPDNGSDRETSEVANEVDHGGKQDIPGGSKSHLPGSKRDLPEQDSTYNKTQKEQDIQQQEPQLNDKKTDSDNAVVVALIDLGISEKVAEFLTGQYNPDRITEKMDYLTFLTAQQPERVKNPCGWLRTAIINDYSRPDGFIPKVEQDQMAAEEERQELEEAAQQRAEEESRKAFLAKEKAEQEQKEAEQHANLQNRYGTSQQTLDLWSPVLEDIRLQLTTSTFYAFMKGAMLLSLEDGQAVIGLPHAHALDWVENRLGNLIGNILAIHHTGNKVNVKFVHLESGDGDS